MTNLAYKGILATIGNTPVVELQNMSPREGVRIYAKLEGQNPTGSVKDRIALKMIERAERDGEISPSRTILEPTSGNTGIALAMIGRIKGYKVTVVMPENVSEERTQLLEAYGASNHLFRRSAGHQRLHRRCPRRRRQAPSRLSHDVPIRATRETRKPIMRGLAAKSWRRCPVWTCFVAGLGTGGTLMGVARRLKEHNPDIKIVAVAPEPDDFISGLRRLEDGFIPPILDLNLLDARMMVGSFYAFRTTRDLLEKEGIFAGISSGSVVHAAIRQAERLEQGNIVCLLADGGWKYLSTSLWTKDYEQLEAESRGKIWW